MISYTEDMKITKIGHCCLLIEVDGKRVMTDPGGFTVSDHVLDDIDVIVRRPGHAGPDTPGGRAV